MENIQNNLFQPVLPAFYNLKLISVKKVQKKLERFRRGEEEERREVLSLKEVEDLLTGLQRGK